MGSFGSGSLSQLVNRTLKADTRKRIFTNTFNLHRFDSGVQVKISPLLSEP